MDTNLKTSKKVLFPELSYRITGLLFSIHNELGMFARERQYGDLFEEKLKDNQICYSRELAISDSGNTVDFTIEEKIVIELKATPFLTRDSYRQIQNYLQQTGFKLGLLVNFRSKYIKPVRIIKIDRV